jgi:lysophospholipase L1-like esterase
MWLCTNLRDHEFHVRPHRSSRIQRVVAGVLVGILAGCGGGSGPTAPVQSTGPGGYPGGADIIAWGDSWTSGIGASNGNSFPEQLAVLTGRSVFNAGVSGQTSDQIVARQGSAPALLTLPNDTIPASGSVAIEDQSTFPVTAEGPGPIAGTLSSVHGTLSFESRLVFTRDFPGSSVSLAPQSPFTPDAFDSRTVINVFWIGGNNFFNPGEVKADIASAVGFLSAGKFVVLGILNAGSEPAGTLSYNDVVQLNADLAAAYPDNFIDARGILVEGYDLSNPADVLDHANDVPPTSLRNDDQHPNDAGYALIAAQVAAFIQNQAW